MKISENLRCLSLFSNYSKLIVDPNKGLMSRGLIPQTINESRDFLGGNVIDIDFNKRAIVVERIQLYYIELHKIIQEMLEFTRPKYHI